MELLRVKASYAVKIDKLGKPLVDPVCGKAPLTTIWHRERKPLSKTLGGDAEKGDKTCETLVGPK